MANEDLIYRLTKAVYSRLGGSADEQTVEQLVTELYREVEPYLEANGNSYSFSQSFPPPLGIRNREGLLNEWFFRFRLDHRNRSRVSQILADAECTITDITRPWAGKGCHDNHRKLASARESATELKETASARRRSARCSHLCSGKIF